MGLGLLERHVNNLLYNIKTSILRTIKISKAYNNKYRDRILVLL